MQPEPKPNPDRDRLVELLEQRVATKADAHEAALRLVTILDRNSSVQMGSGAFEKCQRELLPGPDGQDWIADLLSRQELEGYYNKWNATLQEKAINPAFAVNQLYMGRQLTVKNVIVKCSGLLEFFSEYEAIPKVCVDCFKVQILATDVATLMKIYFIMRILKLPKDCSRKCMVELRPQFTFPYKGYIFCDSVEEGEYCRDAFLELCAKYKVSNTNVLCRLTHGCSEYGEKYPEFKYSTDGAHNSFVRPESWDELELKHLKQPGGVVDPANHFNKSGITIRDVIGFQTWIYYARMIGDPSVGNLVGKSVEGLPQEYVDRMESQAEARSQQRQELVEQLSSGN